MTDKQNYFTYTDNTSDDNDKTMENLHKQIIIDGVDVSGCVQFIQEEKDCCDLGGNCNGWTNCYYKQLKRKEQEYETLASQLDFEVQKKECLEQECEELKKGYAELTDIVSPYMDDFTGYNEELGGFDIVLCVKQLLEQLDQLKAELTRANCQIADDEILQCDMREAIEKLKAENDYLKHKIFRYEEIFKHSADMIKNPVTAIEVETFQSGVKALGNSLIAEENNKLHKTLTEIKEIATHCMKQDICTTCDNSDKCYIEDEEIPTYDVCKLILQKISEV